MSLLAFITILISAFMHATWNYLAKQSEAGFIFVWLYMAVSTIVYLPFVLGFFLISKVQFGWIEFVVITGSAIVHMAYALTLQKGYRVGDLSIVYPLARGSAPMLIAVAAFFLFEERLSIIGMIGISFIVLSIFILTGDLRRCHHGHWNHIRGSKQLNEGSDPTTKLCTKKQPLLPGAVIGFH